MRIYTIVFLTVVLFLGLIYTGVSEVNFLKALSSG